MKRMEFWKVWIRAYEPDGTLSYELVAAYDTEEATRNVDAWLKENQIPAFVVGIDLIRKEVITDE